MYEVTLNEVQINQVIEAMRVLGGSLKWDLIFYGLIPVLGIIITNVMTYFIYRKQYKNQLESLRKESDMQLKSQLKSQQIALKKDLKIKALLNAKNAILDDCRNISLLRLDFENLIRENLSTKIIYEKIQQVEEQNRKKGIIINDTNCLVTDYEINYDEINKIFLIITNSIYYSYCFPEKSIPEIFEKTVIGKDDYVLILSCFDDIIFKGSELMKSISDEISKTVDSIV